MNKRKQVYNIAQAGIKVFEYIANVYANDTQDTLQSLQSEYEQKVQHLSRLTNGQSTSMSPEGCNDPDALAGRKVNKSNTIHNLRRDIVSLSLKIQEVKQNGLTKEEQPVVSRVSFAHDNLSFCINVEYNGGEEGHFENIPIFKDDKMSWEDLAPQSQELLHHIGQFAAELSRSFNVDSEHEHACCGWCLDMVPQRTEVAERILSRFYGVSE